MVGTLIFAAFSYTFAMQFVLIGLVWMPFGAAICVFVAKQRNLNASTYGWAGATYSALFLVPWIYLVLRMCGVSMWNGITYLAYALLYAVWIFAVVLHPTSYDFVALLIVSLLSLVASLILLIDRHRSDREYDAQGSRSLPPKRLGRSSTTDLPSLLYILPFILLFIWLLLMSFISWSEVSVPELLLSPLLLYTGGFATLLIASTLLLVTVNFARE